MSLFEIKEAIHDARTRINIVACMIRDNLIPKDAFQRVSSIQLKEALWPYDGIFFYFFSAQKNIQ